MINFMIERPNSTKHKFTKISSQKISKKDSIINIRTMHRNMKSQRNKKIAFIRKVSQRNQINSNIKKMKNLVAINK